MVFNSMNQAHLHIIFVHIPIILIPSGLVLYLVGLYKQMRVVKLTALVIYLIAGVFSIIAFSLGEGAEEIVEKIPGIYETVIESHEESAEVALWVTLLLSAISICNLITDKIDNRLGKHFTIPLVILGFLSAITLAYTAFEGGKIRHPEAYDQATFYSDQNRIENED